MPERTDRTECIFCQIAAGALPCAKVYESQTILAFLDICPVNKGHTLIIPKDHYQTVLDVPVTLGTDVLTATGLVSRAVMATTGATGFNLNMNTFRTAGQMVDHAHWHIIPRFDTDGFSLWPQSTYDSTEEASTLARKIAERIHQ